MFPRQFSKKRRSPRSLGWFVNGRSLNVYILLVLLGLFVLSLALYYLFFPRKSLPSYKERKLTFKLMTDIAAPRLSFNGTYLLILVTSAPSHFQHREAIRATWANRTSLQSRRQPFSSVDDWKIVFMLGKADANTNAVVEQEASVFNDILLGEFQDSYKNLVIKTIMGLSWASRLNCTHVLKADDDVYIHIPRLIA
ncbi:Beta-1,3-galactosyltransferase 2 [Desmophyllum pertusum]|uniref:Hexosyltransferase n=1 Tax=Desmophyllum pertusum TaxID=174260 RepID=A0A9W9ZEL3_9CNID|nr:Beta-1,3-galactosyltransferase 2 [Desmophyllum pertusum]